jgi:hypothetical protein
MSRWEWPTLKEMLDSTKRVVVFMDKGAENGAVPYLLQQFTMVCTVFYLKPSFHYLVTTHLLDVGR